MDAATVAVFVAHALSTTVVTDVAKVALTDVGGHAVAVRLTSLLAIRLTLVTAAIQIHMSKIS